jgi:hypothetical protein
LCLVEGNLASLHDLVSIKVEHTICSRMISITQKDAIGGPQLKFVKPTLLEDKTLATKSPEMAHSRCLPMHELIACRVQESRRKIRFPTWHTVFTASAQNLIKVLCSSSIVRAISQRGQFILPTTPFWQVTYGEEN